MPRKNQTGHPYLQTRKDNGNSIYFRKFDPRVAPYITGSLQRSWSSSPYALNGGAVVKVSLGNHRDPIEINVRWAEIHRQVEELHKRAVAGFHREVPPPVAPQVVPELTPDQRRALAGQVRHDYLDDHDKRWVDPSRAPLSPLARAVSRVPLFDVSSASYPSMVSWWSALQARIADEGLEAVTIEMEQAQLRDALRNGSTEPVDHDTIPLEEFVPDDPDKPDPSQGHPGAWRVVAEPLSEMTRRLHENNVDLPRDATVARRSVGLELLRAKQAALGDIATRHGGGYIETPARPAPIRLPEPAVVPTMPTLPELCERWVGAKARGPKQVSDLRLYVKRFLAMHGDHPVDRYTKTHVRDFLDMVRRFPRAMKQAVVELPPAEIVAWADAEEEPVKRLSNTTVNAKAHGSLSKLFQLAVNQYDLPKNPCNGLRLPKGDEAPRQALSDKNLTALFERSPVFSLPPRITKGGGGAAAFWIPLHSLFEGLRLEEIGQALVSDAGIEDGIDYIDITPGISEDDESAKALGITKQVKTVASKRRMPVHRFLIAIGWRDYVTKRRKQGCVRLFPDLSAYRERMTKNYSRWFNRYFDRHVSNATDMCFHALRHTFAENLRGEIEDKWLQVLMGHAKKDVTDRYGKRDLLKYMDINMQKLTYSALAQDHLAAVAKFINTL